jgi:hypothetical protein
LNPPYLSSLSASDHPEDGEQARQDMLSQDTFDPPHTGMEPGTPDNDPGPWGFRIFLAFIMAGLIYAVHHIYRSMSIERITPLGPVITMGATEGQRETLWLVQTPKGYYPIRQAVSIEPGAELVLLTMGSGHQYLCNTDRSVCASTAKADRHLAAK